MNLENMVYKDYKWRHNPRKIEVIQDRNIKEQIIPFFGNELQDYGRKKRVIKGFGEFFGEDAIEQYNELYKVFEASGIHYLKVPGISPFLASFVSLKLIGESNPNIIKYEFEFWEYIVDNSKTVALGSDTYHIVKENDTLWSIASTYSLSIDTILKLNPQIKKPDELTMGQKVILS